MQRAIGAGVLILVSFGQVLAGADSASPLQVGSRLELFVDDYLIESMDGVRLRLHTPRPAGIVMNHDKPWEGTTSAYHTVFQDGEIFRMYYRGSSHAGYTIQSLMKPGETPIPEHEQVACYAESRDGIHWTRPPLGLIEFEGSKDNNIVWIGNRAGGHNFAPFKDGNPDAPDSQRYKAVGSSNIDGKPVLLGFVSPDGIRWSQVRDEPIITDGAFDSLNVAFWDSVRQRYSAVYRAGHEGVRSFKFSHSDNFVDWPPGTFADYGDTPREQLYTNGTSPYFRAPHIYLAFPKRFVQWRTMHLDVSGSGVSEGVFISSRDGVHWDRRFMEAFVRPGRDPRSWVHRTNMIAAGVLPTADDEISIYVARHYTSPSAHLERMVLRTDGFVSASAGYGGGEVLTKPLIFPGTNLVLNFATSAAGSIHLEIQDAEGRPLPGFALEESPLIWGDEIEHTVRWERSHSMATSDQPLRRISGKPVRLRFVMKDADLFSLQFR
ncbi:MAG: hypothetical protein OXH11_15045 [Candidatus Aminicenantes bacterium]|nr:hypothetical protein [Candidatus Aminicenantes bacterium]